MSMPKASQTIDNLSGANCSLPVKHFLDQHRLFIGQEVSDIH